MTRGLPVFFAVLCSVEHPDAEVEVDVGGGDAGDLAGPAPGLQHGADELAELAVPDGGEDLRLLVRG